MYNIQDSQQTNTQTHVNKCKYFAQINRCTFMDVVFVPVLMHSCVQVCKPIEQDICDKLIGQRLVTSFAACISPN